MLSLVLQLAPKKIETYFDISFSLTKADSFQQGGSGRDKTCLHRPQSGRQFQRLLLWF